jgi:hypothetical protein
MSEPRLVVDDSDVLSAFQRLAQNSVNDLQPAQAIAKLGAEGASKRAPVLTGALESEYTVEDRYVVNPLSYASMIEFGTIYFDAYQPIQLALDDLGPQSEQIYSDYYKKLSEDAGFDTGG